MMSLSFIGCDPAFEAADANQPGKP